MLVYVKQFAQVMTTAVVTITGKKPINIILTLTFLTWSLYGPKPVTADFGPIMEKLS